jgi:hypothetical protein
MYLFAGLVVLSEKVIKDGAVLLVYPLHLVDVLRHLLRTSQSVRPQEQRRHGISPIPRSMAD